MASILGVETIQHTNGTNALTVDSSGRINMPAKPVFRATHNTSTGYSTNGDIIIYNTALINVGNGYNTTTGKFTAPCDGIYGFSYNYYTDAVDHTMTDLLLNNSTSYGRTETRLDMGNNSIVASGLIIVEMNANDYVWIKNTESGGGTVELIGSATEYYNYFNGFLIA